MSIESVMPFNHFILCHPLLLPSIFPSIRAFSNESALCIRWPKYWNFSFSISPSNEYSEFISFRIDWFDPLAVQGTPKSLLQHHNLKKSFFFLVLSLLYGPALTSIHDYWKNHSFDYWTFISKMMPLIFNILSRFIIAFLPRSKCLLVSWLWSWILEPKKIKSVTVSTLSLIYLHWSHEPDAMIFIFLILSFESAF